MPPSKATIHDFSFLRCAATDGGITVVVAGVAIRKQQQKYYHINKLLTPNLPRLLSPTDKQPTPLQKVLQINVLSEKYGGHFHSLPILVNIILITYHVVLYKSTFLWM